ncbi:putative NADH-ubiquinone oxidoreductase 178 kDa subunit [Aspergillus vadensis CBS 113365]|uniref:NADH-ubiquinone oxidoreductase 178 kDa subunit n=2 Tax=Aspergillus subgen. Circumdati TaxID=2720871 RepID=A0A319BKE9_ASPVC|nr:NADH-ubiquinone oxidoreductase 178 kDa subunit [Aspergillus neoniger CBS 115656]XP_025566173.1 NADH-ubiquinone oxidoreductase 178 kDa subunit [Aspergillus vadensis CBS 113365]PYH35419.1 NADH-ubiquinone oxidoreductase 178 kDa subunit [Aspergillus neoniger CBS 115656]PYH72379.1 NADH-ubiquinone oxidoreductase 178 kDa subunit [Aspergillus vadensis CBS 113365]
MFFARRSVASARLLLRNQQPRRFDSHAAHHAEPVNESFGRSFYVTFGTFASAFVLYQVAKSNDNSGSPSWITNLIHKWTPDEKIFEQRNAIHTAAMEKVAHDRHLFASQGPREFIELKQPEVSFSAVAPYNVAPGQSADLSHVVAHYQRQNQEMEASRVARMQDGKVVSLYE